MIELVKEFLLFGVIEVFIIMMFCKYIGGIKEIRYWHGLILCPIIFILGLIPTPFVKQIGTLLFVVLYVCLLTNKIKIKIPILSIVYMLIIEIFYMFVFDYILKIDLSMDMEIVYKFLILIPMRILEILLIIFYKEKTYGLDLGFKDKKINK